MALLPQFQNDDKDFQLMQNKWAAVINPVVSNPANNSVVLKNVKLSIGSNNIPHMLGRVLQGWTIVRKRAAASIYDNQDNQQLPQYMLTLVSDAAVTVDIEVY
jgi:hypothetical protein